MEIRGVVLLDTGPLVAYINKREKLHLWAVAAWKTSQFPLLTCEAVITEACFLLRDVYGGQETVIGLVRDGIVRIPFHLSEEIASVDELMKRYQSVPMSLADACLVRMSELITGSSLLTLDSDFRIYRKNKNETINLIIDDG